MSIPTKGTRLFVIDPGEGSNPTPKVLTAGCVTSIDGIDTSIPQIETTCLESLAREYVAGMPTPGNATFGINTDPADASHVRLHQLKTAGTTLKWAIGWADGEAVPTLDSDGTNFELPTSRTWLTFDGYMSSYPFNFALNDVVKSTVGIQVSGEPSFLPKS